MLAALASNVALLLLAFVTLFGVAVARGQWRRAYTLLFAGPGLFGILCLAHAHWPGSAPMPPPFPLVAGWGSYAAALGVSLAVILSWGSRTRLRACTAWSIMGALLAVAPLVAGTETPENVLRAVAIGVPWALLSVAAGLLLAGLLAPANAPGQRRIPGWDRLAAWADGHLWGSTAALMALIALGVLCRIPGIWTWAIGPDASRYAAMADALNHHGEFLLPWGDIYSPGTGPQYSHHFPPLFPAILAGFYRLFGFSEATTRLASFMIALLAIAVTYWCTKDLYGRTKGLVAGAVVSLSPVLVMTTNKAYAENLLVVLFVLAMWAILKSLERPWFIVLGALFAGLGYLTKSSMGYFFIIAGLGGLAWRLYWKGVRVLREAAYITAIALFGAMVAWWGWRNYTHVGTFSSSAHLDAAYASAFAHPTSWAVMMLFSFLVMFGLGYLAFMGVLPWLPQLRRIPRMDSEHDSGLWLAIGLPLVLTVVIDSALWLSEGDFFLHNVRYVSFVIVPLTWLIMRHAPRSKQTWAAIGITFAILIAGSLYYTLPNRPLNTKVADAFGSLVHDGDSITFVGDNDVYRYYFAVTHDGRELNHTVLYQDTISSGPIQTTWVVARGDGAGLTGYTKVCDMSQGEGLLAQRYTVWQHREPRVTDFGAAPGSLSC